MKNLKYSWFFHHVVFAVPQSKIIFYFICGFVNHFFSHFFDIEFFHKNAKIARKKQNNQNSSCKKKLGYVWNPNPKGFWKKMIFDDFTAILYVWFFFFHIRYHTTVLGQKFYHMLFCDKIVKKWNFQKCSWICVRNSNKFSSLAGISIYPYISHYIAI